MAIAEGKTLQFVGPEHIDPPSPPDAVGRYSLKCIIGTQLAETKLSNRGIGFLIINA